MIVSIVSQTLEDVLLKLSEEDELSGQKKASKPGAAIVRNCKKNDFVYLIIPFPELSHFSRAN